MRIAYSNLAPDSRLQATGAATFRVDVDIGSLRANRTRAIWGDAFRRPWAYQPLCGLDDHAPPDANTGSARPATPAPAEVAPAAGGELVIALLQLLPKDSEVELADHAETMVRAAAK